jgi:probable HAF family extracellular repeat protein
MWAEDISADGTTVVGKGENAEGRSEAFLWKQGEMRGLGSLLTDRNDFFSEAIAVSSDGSIVVGNSGFRNQQREVFLWTRETGIKPLDKLEGEGRSNAIGVSDNGRVLGTCELGGRTLIFLWDKKTGKVLLNEKLKQLGLDPSANDAAHLSNAAAISANGQYIVGNGVKRTAGISKSGALLIDLGE